MAGVGQVGAALALYWRAQPAECALRSQVRGAIIPGLLGVGEPLIYGVTLPRMKPFITACLGGAAGGLFIGLIAWWGLPIGLKQRLWAVSSGGAAADDFRTRHPSGNGGLCWRDSGGMGLRVYFHHALWLP